VGMCMDALFWAGATLVIVHLDRREGGGESEGSTRAVDGAALQAALLSAKGSRIPACVWDCPIKHAFIIGSIFDFDCVIILYI